MSYIFYFFLEVLLLVSIVILIVGSMWVLRLLLIEFIGFDYVKWLRRKL